LIRLIEMYYKIRVKYGYIIFRVRVIGRIITEILCLVQIDMKRIVSYSSVVHINLILCRLITFFKAGVLGRYVIIIARGLFFRNILYSKFIL